jgi:hypothetical protein
LFEWWVITPTVIINQQRHSYYIPKVSRKKIKLILNKCLTSERYLV